MTSAALPTLQILNNYIQFEVSHGPSDVVSMRLSRSRVTDGEWHHLLIELKSAKEGKDIKYLAVMTLDYGVDQVSGHLYPLWNRPLPRACGRTERPLQVPGPARALVDLRKCFLGFPEFGSHAPPMLRSLESAPHPLSRWSAPGVRRWTWSICASHRDAIGAFSRGFF